MSEVHKESAADRDGRLRKGDLILAVNDISLRDIAFKDAVAVLRETSSPLRLLILRENPQKLFTSHQSRYAFSSCNGLLDIRLICGINNDIALNDPTIRLGVSLSLRARMTAPMAFNFIHAFRSQAIPTMRSG